MRTFLVVLASLLCGGCAFASPTKAVRTFSRLNSSQATITVRLRWTPNTQPPFYTPRGPMREITITEAGRSVSVAPAQISAIEDIWPERITLQSPHPGDYDLLLPYGVGEGMLSLIRVRAFRVVRVADVPLAQPVSTSRQSPNNALQRTEAGHRAGSEFEP